jgi:hypothetical protein
MGPFFGEKIVFRGIPNIGRALLRIEKPGQAMGRTFLRGQSQFVLPRNCGENASAGPLRRSSRACALLLPPRTACPKRRGGLHSPALWRRDATNADDREPDSARTLAPNRPMLRPVQHTISGRCICPLRLSCECARPSASRQTRPSGTARRRRGPAESVLRLVCRR